MKRIIMKTGLYITATLWFMFLTGSQNTAIVEKQEKIIISDTYQYFYSASDENKVINKKEGNISFAKEQMSVESEVIPFATDTLSANNNVSDDTRKVSINFMGDCMLATLHGYNYESSFNNFAEVKSTTYFFDKVRYILDSADLNIANCENVFTDRPLEERYKGEGTRVFWFKSPSKNAEIFRDNGIDFVSIANNHIYDYGNEGKEDTKIALEKADVKYGCDAEPVILEKNGLRIAVICFTLWDNQEEQVKNTLNNLQNTTDIQILFFHGGTESSHCIDSNIQTLCHSFVDCGADLIIGAHPHVLQPIENYNGVDIVYSLGNFVYGGHTRPENETMIYNTKFCVDGNKNVTSQRNVIPCYVFTGERNNYQPAPIENEEHRQNILERILP